MQSIRVPYVEHNKLEWNNVFVCFFDHLITCSLAGTNKSSKLKLTTSFHIQKVGVNFSLFLGLFILVIVKKL